MAVPVTSTTDLLQVGKGIVVFKREGTDTFVDMGNAPEIEFTPGAETLDHFSSREGTRLKDKTVVIEKTGELRILLEEMSTDNLSIILLADVDDSDPDFPIIDIMSRDAVTGEVRFYGTNDVGPQWNIVFPRVDFLPSGSMNLISEEWNQMEITGQLAAVSGSFGTMTPRDTNVLAPVNIAEPQISGGRTQGDVLTASTGTWLNDPTSYTYQWERNGTPISLATNSTYTVVLADVNNEITVVVTATNASGSDNAESAGHLINAYT